MILPHSHNMMFMMAVGITTLLAINSSASASATEQFWKTLEGALQAQQSAVGSWTEMADEVAQRFLSGGRLFVGGSQPGFASEAVGRAGGLIPIHRLKDTSALKAGDILWLGAHSRAVMQDVAIARRAREAGVFVIGFGAREAMIKFATVCNGFIDSGVPVLRYGAPVTGIVNIATLWAFTGEFVSACTRRGRMPTMWQSIMLIGARERNARYRKFRIHNDVKVRPIAPIQLGGDYLRTLIEYMRAFERSEWGKLKRASAMINSAWQRGRCAYVISIGHLKPPALALPNGLCGLKPLPHSLTPNALQGKLRRGDVLYISGYTDAPVNLLDAGRRAGAFTILTLAGRNSQPPSHQLADIVIDAQWRLGDAIVEVPGYDVPILPPSGVMATAIYWALVIDAKRSHRW